MKKYEICVEKSDRILKTISYFLPEYSYSQIEKCLRQKDIKLNGERIKENVVVNKNDIIEIYLNENYKKNKYEVFYEDENIIIFNKQSGIEVCDGIYNIKNDYEAKNNVLIYPVHRLDRNTLGLVVFAKKLSVLDELKNAFLHHEVEKFYFAVVCGNVESEKVLNSYLKKDEKNSIVKIFDDKTNGAVKIKTEYSMIDKKEDIYLLKVKIKAGKTHQIRAHLAHFKIYIVGDEKYGNYEINKKYKKKTQMLQAYKIVFKLNSSSFLKYLNDKKFEIKCEFINLFK